MHPSISISGCVCLSVRPSLGPLRLLNKSESDFGLQMHSHSYLHPFIILLLVDLYFFHFKLAQIVILNCFRSLSNSILVKNGTFTQFQLVCDRQIDGWTDQQTDGWTHLLIEMQEHI